MFRLQETFAVKKGSSICIASSGLKFLFLKFLFLLWTRCDTVDVVNKTKLLKMIDTILFEWDRVCKRNLHVATATAI